MHLLAFRLQCLLPHRVQFRYVSEHQNLLLICKHRIRHFGSTSVCVIVLVAAILNFFT